MRRYQDERRLDFHALGWAIKKAREEKGWAHDYIKNSEKLDFKNPEDYEKSSNYLKSVRVDAFGARIGDMEFELENNNWKLTFIYLHENSYKKLGVDIGR